MDKKEREIIDVEIERVYQLFLERVAEGRGSLSQEINALAKGRVLSSRQTPFLEKQLMRSQIADSRRAPGTGAGLLAPLSPRTQTLRRHA
jgi:hypothetical protein